MLDNLDEKEVEKLKQISEIYVQAKALICYAEEIDPDSKSNIQVINELRYAFDHLIRVFYRKLLPENNDTLPDDYFQKNLEKVIGHVYRAGFDALDGIVLSIKYKINKELEGIPSDIITNVFPDYYNIKIKVLELSENVARHREKKDIGQDIIRLYDDYVEDVEKLKGDYKKTVIAIPVIIDEFNAKKTGDRRKLYIWIILSLLFIVLTVFLTREFGQKPSPNLPPIEKSTKTITSE